MFVFVAGGWNDTAGVLNSVDRFNIFAKKWVEMPKMNISRQRAASCAINNEVYVFCGTTGNQVILNSIERLSNAEGRKEELSPW